MSLRTYKEKRRFKETPEPEGTPGPGGGALRFVVQKHAARRLHYDFRLELDGVLKSWAVPKGPSLDPQDKRLAVMVEDHPLEYGDFEGVIPAGNYGAGTVMVWDEGTYTAPGATDRSQAEAIIRAGLQAGHITFLLAGTKLRGEFALVKLKRGEQNAWLLIKARDQFASPNDVILQERSAATGRTLEQIRSNEPPIPRDPPKSPRGGKTDPMPRNIRPMLAHMAEAPFDRDGWLFEVKWDGYRAIAEVEPGRLRLYSRNHNPYEQRFSSICDTLRRLQHEAVLDGEIVVVDAQGRSHFQLLQNYQRTGRGRLVYYVFDLLYLDGQDLRKQPLRRRKELLSSIVQGLPNIRLSEHVEAAGVAFFAAVVEQGLEGIMAKKADSPYREGLRSSEWLKIKARQRQEAVIGGFTEPRGSRKELGAVVLGLFEDGKFVHIGQAGSGFTQESLRLVRSRLDPLVQKECPFAKRPRTDTKATWVRPELVCEVAFADWTDDGRMRLPIFLGLREDKAAKDVRRELPKPIPDQTAPSTARSDRSSTSPPHDRTTSAPLDVPLTNLDKIYWPDEGYTKRDLIEYYRTMAPVILPYLLDRPQSLNRHPNGIKGQSFYQKDISKQSRPEWVDARTIFSEHDGREITYVVCRNEQTILFLANLGCIELNPWFSRIGTLDRPDYAVIDLDPTEALFEHVVEAAQMVRKVLDQAGAPCYCKTSGKRGLHCYIPLGAKYDYDQARQFGEIIANVVHARLPATTSVVRSPALRRGLVYLDFLQNRRGQTLAAPYSVRPWPGATVSTPLKWSEVRRGLDPGKYTIRTVPRRVDRLGDLWQPVLGPGIDLMQCLANLQQLLAR